MFIALHARWCFTCFKPIYGSNEFFCTVERRKFIVMLLFALGFLAEKLLPGSQKIRSEFISSHPKVKMLNPKQSIN